MVRRADARFGNILGLEELPNFNQHMLGNTMGIFDNQDAIATPATNGKNTVDRPKSQVWLNIGYTVEFETDEGEMQSHFVKLPFGLGLDTMNDSDLDSSSPEWLARTMAGIKFKNDLLEVAKKLAPGEERIISGKGTNQIQIQLKRVGKRAVAMSDDDNPFITNAPQLSID